MQAMKFYGDMEVYLHTFLTSELNGGECSTSCPVSLPSNNHPTHNHTTDFVIQACPDDVHMVHMAVGWERESCGVWWHRLVVMAAAYEHSGKLFLVP